jgi:hypothetical protein
MLKEGVFFSICDIENLASFFFLIAKVVEFSLGKQLDPKFSQSFKRKMKTLLPKRNHRLEVTTM